MAIYFSALRIPENLWRKSKSGIRAVGYISSIVSWQTIIFSKIKLCQDPNQKEIGKKNPENHDIILFIIQELDRQPIFILSPFLSHFHVVSRSSDDH